MYFHRRGCALSRNSTIGETGREDTSPKDSEPGRFQVAPPAGRWFRGDAPGGQLAEARWERFGKRRGIGMADFVRGGVDTRGEVQYIMTHGSLMNVWSL